MRTIYNVSFLKNNTYQAHIVKSDKSPARIARYYRDGVCKIICVNHHRLFDTPVSCIMHNGFDNTVISWKKLVEKFLGGNDYVTEN